LTNATHHGRVAFVNRTMASVMIDEIRLRAHARPLDEPEP
jgi:hypothetical protein